jgi:hypothetical protein
MLPPERSHRVSPRLGTRGGGPLRLKPRACPTGIRRGETSPSLDTHWALGDNEMKSVTALEPDDLRRFEIAVAGPAASLIAKAWKLGERDDVVADEDQFVFRSSENNPVVGYIEKATVSPVSQVKDFAIRMESPYGRRHCLGNVGVQQKPPHC